MTISKRITNLSQKEREAIQNYSQDFTRLESDMKQSLREQAGIPVQDSKTYYKELMRKGKLKRPGSLDISDLYEMARNVDNSGNETEAAARERVHSPLSGIRTFCVMCVGGSPGAVRSCCDIECSFWLFRFGTNPMYGRK